MVHALTILAVDATLAVLLGRLWRDMRGLRQSWLRLKAPLPAGEVRLTMLEYHVTWSEPVRPVQIEDLPLAA